LAAAAAAAAADAAATRSSAGEPRGDHCDGGFCATAGAESDGP
jgi:hypothetical protein